MVSSFRLTRLEEQLLARAAKRTGKSRSQLVREAVQVYCRKIVTGPRRSLYDRLMEAGFQSVEGRYTDLSSNKKLQRKLISDKVRQASN
jgi:hypothetical protein